MGNIENLITMSGVFLLVAYIDPGTGSMIIQVAIGFLGNLAENPFLM